MPCNPEASLLQRVVATVSRTRPTKDKKGPAIPIRKPRTTVVPELHRQVYRLVRKIPRGKVVTYGQVAAILGHPRAARAIGQALRLLPRGLLRIVPWQRVVNASGGISIRGDVYRPDLQRELLEAEGVRFSRGGKIDLKKTRWPGPRREWASRIREDLD